MASYAGGSAWAGLLYAATVYEKGELGHAAQLLNVYLPRVCEAGLPDHMMLGHLMLARIAMSDPNAEPDPARASQILTELEALGHRLQSSARSGRRAFKSRSPRDALPRQTQRRPRIEQRQ